ncbi:MAG TPA: hypothetical protein V6D17_11775 [Candidatus Obscuribacterales bacterium]
MFLNTRNEQRKQPVQAMPKRDFGGWYQVETNVEEAAAFQPLPVDRNALIRKRVADFHCNQTKSEIHPDEKTLKSKTANSPSFGLIVKAALIYVTTGHSI